MALLRTTQQSIVFGGLSSGLCTHQAFLTAQALCGWRLCPAALLSQSWLGHRGIVVAASVWSGGWIYAFFSISAFNFG